MSILLILRLLYVLILPLGLLTIQLPQLCLMITIPLIQLSGMVILHLLDFTKMLLLLGCQVIVVLPLVLLHDFVFIGLFVEVLLIDLLNHLEMLVLSMVHLSL